MTELPRWCPACHGSFNLADELNGNMSLCVDCEVVTHGGKCAERHVPRCKVGKQHDHERLAAWSEGVRGW